MTQESLRLVQTSGVLLKSTVIEEAQGNKTLNAKTVLHICAKAGYFMLNMAAVFFFENMCIICFTDRITYQIQDLYPQDQSFFMLNAFTIFNFCY